MNWKCRLSGAIVGTLCFISLAAVAQARTDRDCSDFTYQQDAQAYFVSIGGSRTNNADRLDKDGDGQACDLLPRRTTASAALPLPVAQTEDDGLSTGWVLVILAAIGAGVWYYFAEMHGPENQRAPHPDNLPYNTKTMPYESYLKTPEWRAIRQMALDRDGQQCTRCGATERLQAHHLNYSRRGHEKLKDLQTLCKGCHETEHERRRLSKR